MIYYDYYIISYYVYILQCIYYNVHITFIHFLIKFSFPFDLK